MSRHTLMTIPAELQPLLELTQRVGSDPLLTQGSTGNSSAKIHGVLWVKASGRWMADAIRNDIFIGVDLSEVTGKGLQQDAESAERYRAASIETLMHATLPHLVVLHTHCVNTIAWAVRSDAPVQLQTRLKGLRWQWVPYIASGLPLAHALERTLSARPDTDVFVLGNHGLVIGGEDASAVENLLTDVRNRLAIPARQAHPADYAALLDLSRDSPWDLPDDDEVHALGTDAITRAILSGGLLYPCQAIFSDSQTPDLFRAIPLPNMGEQWQARYRDRPFLIIEGRGVVVSRGLGSAELAMISGLAQVVQRLSASAPLRYLTASEIAGISNEVARRYRTLSSAGGAGRRS